MDNLNAMREWVEELSANEKIGEGDYLSIMNHMKKVYEAIPPPAPKYVDTRDHAPTHGPVGELVRGLMDTVVLKWGLMFKADMVHCGVRGFSVWNYAGFEFPVQRRVETMEMLESYMANPTNPVNVMAMTEFLQTRVGEHWIKQLGYYNRGLWREETHRDIWLAIPLVRKYVIENVLEKKKHMASLLKKWSATDDGGLNLSHVLDELKVPFEGDYQWGKDKWVARTDEEKKKLHAVRVNVRLGSHDTATAGHAPASMDFKCYTRYIQLARGHYTNPIYTMMVGLALLMDLEEEISMTKINLDTLLLYSDSERQSYYQRYGNMWRNNNDGKLLLDTSGITAKTRDKKRTYVDANYRISIQYTGLLNEGTAQ